MLGRIAPLLLVLALACTGGEPAEVAATTGDGLGEGFESRIDDPGDATEGEVALLTTLQGTFIPDKEILMGELFTEDAVFDTAIRGTWSGLDQISERLRASAGSWRMPVLGGFTRIGDVLVFNWTLIRPDGAVFHQGVQARFSEGRIASLDVTSAGLAFCLEGWDSLLRCRDYETREVRSGSGDSAPICGPTTPPPCVQPTP